MTNTLRRTAAVGATAIFFGSVVAKNLSAATLVPTETAPAQNCLSQNALTKLAEETFAKAKENGIYKNHTISLDYLTADRFFAQQAYIRSPHPNEKCWPGHSDIRKYLSAAAGNDPEKIAFVKQLTPSDAPPQTQANQGTREKKNAQRLVRTRTKVNKVLNGRLGGSVAPRTNPRVAAAPRTSSGRATYSPGAQFPRSIRRSVRPPPSPPVTRRDSGERTARQRALTAQAQKRERERQLREQQKARHEQAAAERRRRQEQYFARRRQQARASLAAEDDLEAAINQRKRVAELIKQGAYPPGVAERVAFQANAKVERARQRVKALDPLAEEPARAPARPRQTPIREYSFDGGRTWAPMKASHRPNGSGPVMMSLHRSVKASSPSHPKRQTWSDYFTMTKDNMVYHTYTYFRNGGPRWLRWLDYQTGRRKTPY